MAADHGIVVFDLDGLFRQGDRVNRNPFAQIPAKGAHCLVKRMSDEGYRCVGIANIRIGPGEMRLRDAITAQMHALSHFSELNWIALSADWRGETAVACHRQFAYSAPRARKTKHYFKPNPELLEFISAEAGKLPLRVLIGSSKQDTDMALSACVPYFDASDARSAP